MKLQASKRSPISAEGVTHLRDGRVRALEAAFRTFSQLSENLTASYQVLENRVAELTTELAEARGDNAAHGQEKERLARRLQSLLHALPGGVVLLDGAGCVQQCNPAAIALLGEPLLGIAWRHIILRAFAPRSDDGHEISLRDGRLVSIATTPLGTEPGQILLLTEVTETRRLQQRLNHHQRLSAMGEMAASLAHQIRTPLASALLYAAHLQSPTLALPERQRIGKKIQSRMRHLEQLVNDMLLFSRDAAVGSDAVAVADLLHEVRRVFDVNLVADGARIDIVNAAPDAMLQGNRETLLSALLNLVNNALQAGGEHGRVELKAVYVQEQSASAMLDLQVSDNGPGIPADTQAHLFEPFFTTRAQGTGLGLAVVQAIAQGHHGVAWFETTAGVGSRFAMRLPLMQAARIVAHNTINTNDDESARGGS
jgi:two-component system, sensor histidine kinase FlrB